MFTITNVTIINFEKGGRLTNQNVLVSGNRITSVGTAAKVAVSQGVLTLDGRGKFLIPGLWDMHIHSFEHLGIDYSYNMEPYKLYIANGVTGVRDMGSSFLQFAVGKKRIESGQLVAPRIVASGPLLEGGQPPLKRVIISKYVPTPEAGRLAVDTLAEAGVDFLKIHDGLSRETYFAIAKEAERKRMVFAGHIPEGITITEASDAGQKSIEHLDSLIAASGNPINYKKCQAVLRHLKRNGTWLTPTLLPWFLRSSVTTPELKTQLKYLKPKTRNSWAPLPLKERRTAKLRHELNLKLTQLVMEAGVKMMAGTDTTTFRIPGFALHRELSLLVDAGLTPTEVLRMTTINPAIYLNMAGLLGTITQGKIADLVLLDKDPLSDINHTTHIAAVVTNGQLFAGAKKQQLFEDVLASTKEVVL